MQKFSGKITHVMPVEERGEWKSVKFRVEELEGQYPQSCVFTKSAKGDNRKWVENFEKDNPIGSIVEVEYTFKSNAWKDKFINETVAYKVVNNNYSASTKKAESVSQETFNKVADANGLVQEPLPTDNNAQIDDDLPF